MNEKEFEWVFEWANGSATVRGKTYQKACGKITEQENLNNILTGFLVRVKQTDYNVPKDKRKEFKWGYWDVREFWKHLARKPRKVCEQKTLHCKRVEGIV